MTKETKVDDFMNAMNYHSSLSLLLCSILFLASACVSDQTQYEENLNNERKASTPPESQKKNPSLTEEKEDKTPLFYLEGKAVYESQYKDYLYENLGREYLQIFITEQLVLWKAKQLGIRVTKKEAKNWVGEKIGTAIQQAGGREALRKKLAQNNISMKSFLTNITKNAPTMVRLNKIIKYYRVQDKALKRAYQQKFGAKVTIKQVFFSLEKAYQETSREKAKKLAERTLKKIRSQELTFAQGVKFYSEAESAKKNGSLGWVHENKITPQIRKEIQKLKARQISDPIGTKRGFHIFYLKEKKGSYINLYQLFFSANPKNRLEKEDRENIRQKLMDRAEKVYKKIKEEGLNFQEARLKGEDKGKAISFRRYACPLGKKIEEKAFSMKKGDISSPILSGQGIHIIKVTKISPPMRPFDKACKEDLKKIVVDEDITQEEIRGLKRKLRQEAKIRLVE